MIYSIEAACGCNKGKIRANNEDNFYFNDMCLEEVNDGLSTPVYYEKILTDSMFMAVFDGMGGENFGEAASFAAASQMQALNRTGRDFFISKKKYLANFVRQLNEAVVLSKKEHLTERMGTTMAALYFTERHAYVCNVGDSRVYRLRGGMFVQLSKDHVLQRPGSTKKKAPLSQHLGIDPEEMLIEPFISKDELHKEDVYLLCSDGLTDMVSDLDICNILLENKNSSSCVKQLINKALENGGRDNITAIVCKIV